MLEFSNSMTVAQKVLDILMADTRTKDMEAIVEAYQNGREQGYAIIVTAYEPDYKVLAIRFAEYRRSDDIVVYCGDWTNQSIDEKAYASARLFRSDNHHGAADFIVQTMKDHLFNFFE